MILFTNPGLIDLDAVRTMGVSVKRPGSFGFFGTGLKFAIATILRGGGLVTVYRGTQAHDFTLRERTIRDQVFQIVCMDDVEMGITDQLGRNWEPWMVLRELGCNALDEGGEFSYSEPDFNSGWMNLIREGHTTIVVMWDALDEAWEQRGDVFVGERPVLLATLQVEVREGESGHIYYRGVRAGKLQHRSLFTYNILSDQVLTEDRTIASMYYPDGEIRRTWLECTDMDLLRRALCPGSGSYEWDIKFDGTNREASREFLDVVLEARARRDERLSSGARAVLSSHVRRTSDSSVSYSRSRYLEDEFGTAIQAICELFHEDQMEIDKIKMIVVDDDSMPEGVLTMPEEGRIYIDRQLLSRPRREIADQILRCLLQLRCPYDTADATLDLIVPAMLDLNSLTLRDRRRGDEPLQLDEPDPDGTQQDAHDRIVAETRTDTDEEILF